MEVQVSSPTDRNEYFLALIKVRKVGEYETGVGREISCYLVGSTDGEFDENAGKKIKIHLCTKSPGTCTHGAVYHCAKSRIVTTEMMDGSHWMSGLTTRIEDLEQLRTAYKERKDRVAPEVRRRSWSRASTVGG